MELCTKSPIASSRYRNSTDLRHIFVPRVLDSDPRGERRQRTPSALNSSTFCEDKSGSTFSSAGLEHNNWEEKVGSTVGRHFATLNLSLAIDQVSFTQDGCRHIIASPKRAASHLRAQIHRDLSAQRSPKPKQNWSDENTPPPNNVSFPLSAENVSKNTFEPAPPVHAHWNNSSQISMMQSNPTSRRCPHCTCENCLGGSTRASEKDWERMAGIPVRTRPGRSTTPGTPTEKIHFPCRTPVPPAPKLHLSPRTSSHFSERKPVLHSKPRQLRTSDALPLPLGPRETNSKSNDKKKVFRSNARRYTIDSGELPSVRQGAMTFSPFSPKRPSARQRRRTSQDVRTPFKGA